MKDLFNYLYSIRNDDILSCKDEIKSKVAELFPDRVIDDDIAMGNFVVHFPSQTYLYTSNAEKTFGKEHIRNKVSTVEEFFKKMHPMDVEVHQQKMLPVFFTLVKEINTIDLINWHFSFNFRILNESGMEKTFMCRNMAVTDDNRDIIFLFGKAVEISSFAASAAGKVTLRAIHSTEKGIEEYVKVFTADENPELSKREKEVLTLIKRGYSSKQIADELFISINTVNNHRKNMLQKTGLKNTAELITKATENGEI